MWERVGPQGNVIRERTCACGYDRGPGRFAPKRTSRVQRGPSPRMCALRRPQGPSREARYQRMLHREGWLRKLGQVGSDRRGAELESRAPKETSAASAGEGGASSSKGLEGDGMEGRWARPLAVDPTPGVGVTGVSAKEARGGSSTKTKQAREWSRVRCRQSPNAPSTRNRTVVGWTMESAVNATDRVSAQGTGSERFQASAKGGCHVPCYW